MKRFEAYPSKYLSAGDLAKGPKVTTVTSVAHEAMADGRMKPTVYLNGYQKGVVVNKTNAEVLYTLSGSDDDEDWAGVSVELYSESTRRPDGTPCQAIRFRVPPKERKKVTEQTLDDEVPF